METKGITYYLSTSGITCDLQYNVLVFPVAVVVCLVACVVVGCRFAVLVAVQTGPGTKESECC